MWKITFFWYNVTMFTDEWSVKSSKTAIIAEQRSSVFLSLSKATIHCLNLFPFNIYFVLIKENMYI